MAFCEYSVEDPIEVLKNSAVYAIGHSIEYIFFNLVSYSMEYSIEDPQFYGSFNSTCLKYSMQHYIEHEVEDDIENTLH